MADYETVTLSAGETRTIDVNDDYDGEMSGVLIDQSASGAGCRITADGDFTIRDVGLSGKFDGFNDRNQIKVMVPSGAQGVFQNVYMLDGAVGGASNNGVLVDADSAGTVTFRNVAIGHYSDNGIYGANADGNVTVEIEGCYGLNNNISQFRIGGAGSYIRDSVVHVTSQSDVPAAEPGRESLNGRGIRLEYNRHPVENTHIANDAGWEAVEFKRGGCGDFRNCQVRGEWSDDWGGCSPSRTNVGSSPSTSPPSGVPMTAKQAAAGLSGGSGGSDMETHQITVTAPEVDPNASISNEYSFVVETRPTPIDVSGRVGSVGEDNVSITPTGSNYRVDGVTGNGYGDAFRYDGKLLEINEAPSNQQDLTFTVDGTEVKQSDLPYPADNKAPAATFNTTVNRNDGVIHCDASGSSDPDGSVEGYDWNVTLPNGTQSNASGQAIDVTIGDYGQYTIKLTVTDDDGATATATRTETVTRPENTKPVARIDGTSSDGKLSLSAAASSDPDGQITSYKWDISGPESVTRAGQAIELTDLQPGTYNVTLTVTDNRDATGSASATFEVGGGGLLSGNMGLLLVGGIGYVLGRE